MTPTEIRPLSAADHEAWLPLWKGYQEFYKVQLADAATAQTWQRFLDPAEPMHAALAWRDGKAIGMVHWIFHRSCWTTGDYCYLQDLFVAPDVRSSGAGRALIEHVYADARAQGAARVYWLTHETNTDAMHLYSGFLQYRKVLA